MRTFALLALFSLPIAAAHAQAPVATGEPVHLAGGDEQAFMHPRWSPDGRLIAFTTGKYDGLWVSRPDGTGLRQLSDEPGAGFGFQWSPDGESIVARVARYEGVRRLHALKLFDVSSGEARLLTDYRTEMLGLPRWSEDGSRVYLARDGQLESFASDPAAPDQTADAPAFLEHQGRLTRANASVGTVAPVAALEGRDIVNLTYSPDGSQVAFEIIGGNLHVMNVDGSGLRDLGPGNRPQWSPDGAWIVFMRTEDDGHAFTASDLYAVRTDGTGLVRLTDTPDRLEMSPSWSPDGSRIAFEAMNEGALYLLPVTR